MLEDKSFKGNIDRLGDCRCFSARAGQGVYWYCQISKVLLAISLAV